MDDRTNDDTPDEGRGALFAALAKFQSEVREILNTSDAQYGKYADLTEVLSAVNPALNKNGLCLFQGFDYTPEMKHILITTIAHSSGASVVSRVPLVAEGGSGRGNPLHNWGGAVTYQRRYCALSILGLSAGLVDDDGQHATPFRDATPQRRTVKPASRAQDATGGTGTTNLDSILKLIDDAKSETQLRVIAKAAKRLKDEDMLNMVREAYQEKLTEIKGARDQRHDAVLAALADPETSEAAIDYLGTIGVSIASSSDVHSMTPDELTQFQLWQQKK